MRFRYSAAENGKLIKKAIVYTRDEHNINPKDADKEAVYIIERLRANGFDSYIVGGAVRDFLVGKKPKDFDIVTSAPPVKLKKIFKNSRIIGHRFRLVHVFFGPKIYEVSTFRSIKDGPTSNTFGTIEEDVLRRDFTINALFYDPISQVVVDYIGGMKDIKSGIIRPIIPLGNIFTDDPVRMIRAVKYSVCTGFSMPFSLKRKIKKQAKLLKSVSNSRLTEEVFKIINSPYVSSIVESLDNFGLYNYLQPRAVKLFKTKSGFREKYLKSLEDINHNENADNSGEALSAMISDYLEDEADWYGDKDPVLPDGVPKLPAERYKEVFIIARKFVLPMNPPRVQLEKAIRLLFGKHGVSLKKTRFIGKTQFNREIKKELKEETT